MLINSSVTSVSLQVLNQSAPSQKHIYILVPNLLSFLIISRCLKPS